MESVQTKRENNQLVPFTFEGHAVRTVMIKIDLPAKEASHV
jgi:prophage antirepressor-like protein